MNEHGCQRAVLDLLRTEYGVTDAQIVGGGKHMQLTFTAPQGTAKIKTTWPRNPIDRDWGVTLDVKTKDIRRMLGGPVRKPDPDRPKKEPIAVEVTLTSPNVLADKIRDKLPSLAAQLAPRDASPPIIMGSMAMYGDSNLKRSGGFGLRVRFFVPSSIGEGWVGQGIEALRTSNDVWHLRLTNTSRRQMRVDGRQYLFDAGREQALWEGFTEPFGTTPAEYVRVGDDVDVRLLTDRIRPVEERARKVSRTKPVQSAPTELPTTVLVEPTMAPTVDDIRAALAAIRRIEAETPYRLIRDGEAWVFDPGLARIV